MEQSEFKQYLIQAGLFLLTLCTTTLAGAEWMFGKFVFYGEEPLSIDEFVAALQFSVPFLGILTVHEFGHYLTAWYYKVKVSLPYYIPLWLGFFLMPSIGTAGAFIRIKEAIRHKREIFDIGIAGPLAGFIIALAVLFYGFTHLPPAEYIYEIHPEYEVYGLDYADHVYDNAGVHNIRISVGKSLLFSFFEKYVASDPALVPNKYELYHYPYLFAGLLALFFTALNLLPIGQLDGGHVLFGLLGHKKASLVSRIFFVLLVFLSGVGVITFNDSWQDLMIGLLLYIGFLYLVFYRFETDKSKRLLYAIVMCTAQMITERIVGGTLGFEVYLVFCLLLGRVLGVDHPPARYNAPIGTFRTMLGWIALIIFVISFTPAPLVFE
ncbi:MAG: site-2 protease family protein [Cyclobacteriaceae bacterium]